MRARELQAGLARDGLPDQVLELRHRRARRDPVHQRLEALAHRAGEVQLLDIHQQAVLRPWHRQRTRRQLPQNLAEHRPREARYQRRDRRLGDPEGANRAVLQVLHVQRPLALEALAGLAINAIAHQLHELVGQGLFVELQPHRASVDRARLEGPVAHIAMGLGRKLHLRRRHEDVAIGLQPQALVGVAPGFLPPQAPGALRKDFRAVLPRNHHPEADRDLRAHLQRQLDLGCRRQGHAGEGIPQPVLLHHYREARVQRPFRKPELHLGVARHMPAEAL